VRARHGDAVDKIELLGKRGNTVYHWQTFVLVDPFRGGRPLERPDLERLAAEMLGSASRLDPARHLAPAGLRSIVVRLLLNLEHAHERRRDHARALVVCDRLVDLTSSPRFRRDRGLHALALGACEQAVDDLEAYLEAEGERAEDAARVRGALERARAAEGVEPS